MNKIRGFIADTVWEVGRIFVRFGGRIQHLSFTIDPRDD